MPLSPPPFWRMVVGGGGVPIVPTTDWTIHIYPAIQSTENAFVQAGRLSCCKVILGPTEGGVVAMEQGTGKV
jgi:hypothetical protein